MSLPKFPVIRPPLTIEDSLNMILTSIAMEELGLSHIINAEGEKLQYVLGTLGRSCEGASVRDVLAVNESIKGLLDSVIQSQAILKGKMECAIGAIDGKGYGPTGPTGPAGAPGSCCAVSFTGCTKQCWISGKPMKWLRSECSSCCSMELSYDCNKIILDDNRCYVVSFSIDICVDECESKYISVGVQTYNCHKKVDRFISHTPVVHGGSSVTVSAGGVLVSTRGCPGSSELTINLLSPASAKVNQSSICVMEI